ncbi:MAG: hypothetical protein PF692_11490 [Kiritimatiellae bacterium]|jgi:hypothetical protein|nr:hypothetical protein [Kiritimatiellia bacterium]
MKPFTNNSFWNTPISSETKTDERNDIYMEALRNTQNKNKSLYINHVEWTIPVYEVHGLQIEKVKVKPRTDTRGLNGFAPNFDGWAPIPEWAKPDGEWDAHMSIIDIDSEEVYDFYAVRYEKNGEISVRCAIKYDLYGSGVFDDLGFSFDEGSSVHDYGPCRAPGVPAIGGLVYFDEIEAGCIEHKLAMFSDRNAKQQYVWPAIWADGTIIDGIPEGAVLQLDPNLDLEPFNLSPAAKTIAIALQKYGAVNVDAAGGTGVYVENLNYFDNKSWSGKIDTGWELEKLGLEHFRFPKLPPLQNGGRLPVIK